MNVIAIHPATLLWWEQREQCRRCEHHYDVELRHKKHYGHSRGGERCKASNYEHGARGVQHMYCIDARLPEGRCGPDAKLFTPKKESTK